MKIAFALVYVLSFALAFTAFPADEEQEGKPAKVLLIGKQPDHPHGSHMYLHTCDVLAKCLRLENGVEAVVSDGWPKDAAVLEGVKTIVVYTSPAAEFLMIGPQAKRFDEMMTAGVGLVTIHWASSVYQKNLSKLGKRWQEYLGGTWVSNVGITIGKSALERLDPKHPIFRGVPEVELRDEFYLNPTITTKAKPLLRAKAKGKDTVVAWAHEREDGGRAYGTTLGHFYDNFQDDAFRRTIVNAILWTAHVDVPEKGARVDIGEAALALPPKPEK